MEHFCHRSQPYSYAQGVPLHKERRALTDQPRLSQSAEKNLQRAFVWNDKCDSTFAARACQSQPLPNVAPDSDLLELRTSQIVPKYPQGAASLKAIRRFFTRAEPVRAAQ